MRQSRENRPGSWKKFLKIGALGLFVSTSSWAVEEQAPVGLRGLLPAKSPVGLQSKDFELLDGNWQAWGEETNLLVEKLYSEEALDLAGQHELLNQLQARVQIMETALKNASYKQLHGPLADLHGRLARRVVFSSAVLEILEADPNAAQKSRSTESFGQLSAAIAGVRSDLGSFQGGDLWIPYLDLETLTAAATAADNSPTTTELMTRVKSKLTPVPEWSDAQKEFLARPALAKLSDAVSSTLTTLTTAAAPADPAKLRELSGLFLSALDEYEAAAGSAAATNARVAYNALKDQAPDGGARLSELMRAHYYNYNLRVTASEGLLRRVLSDSRSESSWVNDCVMGARINGQQVTNSTVSVDLRPSSDSAQIALVVDGSVSANTTGYTSEATVFSTGYHYFRAEKGVFYDGHKFSTTPASVGVNANTQFNEARTKHSGIPLIGRIADSIALDIARDRAGEANAYTADQIRNEVGPRLDSEATTKFDKANLELETRVWGPLREQGMYPDSMHWSSTDSEALIRSRLMDTDELGGTNPAPNVSVPTDGVLIQIHESLLGNGADRFELASKVMTESELRTYLEERLSKLMGKTVDLPDPVVPEGEQPQNNTLTFDAVDPIRFQVDGGEVKLIMRAGLKPQDGEEIPVQIISVPLSFEVTGDKVLMKRGSVGVRPIGKVDNPGAQVTRARIMSQNIQRALPDKTFEAEFERTIDDRKVKMSITGIDARDGWLSIQAR